MCGICGQFNYERGGNVHPEDLARMTGELVHRGPDDVGYFTDKNLGLGFRRLSIIDLSGGHQPMANRDGSVWVIFNGEIYNFQEIRDKLETLGHLFATKSDTEVIVHGYVEWEDDVLDHLNGMFGLAIWDVKRRKLMLARDRMGIKPLYYAVQNGRLLFGSEIRAILANSGERPTIDPAAIASFLQYRYTPAPDTILKGIKKLPAGARLIVEEGGEPKVERWWRFSPDPFEPMPADVDATEELLHIYRKAVKRHLISDVPVGLLLSGGIDSALLLALMSDVQGAWQTYSIGYGTDFADDELQDAAETARTLGASNVAVQISRSDFEAAVGNVCAALEEPVATSSVVPMYYICQRARDDVTVALIGQGPDEMFGGYKRHLGVHYGQYWRRLPKSLRWLTMRALTPMRGSESVRRALDSLNLSDRMARYERVFSLLSQKSVESIFRQEALPQSEAIPTCWQELSAFMQKTDELGGLQFLEIRSSLPDELLLYADKLSMAHSLELRVPYLDVEAVEYAERLNASFKVRNGGRKHLHKLVAKRFLPRHILMRKKRGFAQNVVNDWIRRSLSSSMDRVLLDNDSLIYNYLNPIFIRRLLSQHKAGHIDHHKLLFSLVLLENVLRMYARQPVRTGSNNLSVPSSVTTHRAAHEGLAPQ